MIVRDPCSTRTRARGIRIVDTLPADQVDSIESNLPDIRHIRLEEMSRWRSAQLRAAMVDVVRGVAGAQIFDQQGGGHHI